MKRFFSFTPANLPTSLIAFIPAISGLAKAVSPEHFNVDVDQTQTLSTYGS